jgi:hypothetical protein
VATPAGPTGQGLQLMVVQVGHRQLLLLLGVVLL